MTVNHLSYKNPLQCLIVALGLLALSTGVSAQVVNVTADIAVSTTWTANNTYNLQNQIYVLPGATLTIEAGTVIASTPTVNGSGSLAVTQGAQIFIQGTNDQPVIMTSTADTATWMPLASHPTGGDPKTGTWREAANEWGNLTIMGRGFISENATTGNVNTCNANNIANMEGLIANPPPGQTLDPNVIYGGGDDNDDSGTISHLSIRYGGRVVGQANELNGLSLGGIGRATDIHHLEIMNNVDDGIEIWGGTVNLKHFAIWNIGDDSLDIDQGYRGRIQHGLIVQGYSINGGTQGSGIGDNLIECDGAEDSDWQPVTTTTMYNMTLIGQALQGDGALTYRDNARVQFRNSLIIEVNELVRFDNLDGDGAQGYGHNGTLSWAATWTTPYNMVPPLANDCPPGTYAAQTSGNLTEVVDCAFFNGIYPRNDTEATARGVFAAANNNEAAAALPIAVLTRVSPPVNVGLLQERVLTLDPRAVPGGAAFNNVGQANTAEGFWSKADYRGAFDATTNWLAGWTASEAFGFTPSQFRAPGAVPGQAATVAPTVSPALIEAVNLSNGTLAKNAAGDVVRELTSGPHFLQAQFNDFLTFTFEGAPNTPFLFIGSSILNPGQFVGFGPSSLDVGDLLGVGLGSIDIILDGTQPVFPNVLANLDAAGQTFVSFPNPFPPCVNYHFQMVSLPFARFSNAISLESL